MTKRGALGIYRSFPSRVLYHLLKSFTRNQAVQTPLLEILNIRFIHHSNQTRWFSAGVSFCIRLAIRKGIGDARRRANWGWPDHG